MARTEFDDPNDPDLDQFAPRRVLVEGSFQKALVHVSDDGRRIVITTRDGREEWGKSAALNFAESIIEAATYIDAHPHHYHGSVVKATKKDE